jgi:oxalate decarboxylase/phosphoglucose isomerase-like protein (cupin superfamily)
MSDLSFQNNVPDPLLSGKELPSYKFELEKSNGKILGNSFGKEATVEQLPISKGIAGVSMQLEPGVMRELHSHATPAEWAFDGFPKEEVYFARGPPPIGTDSGKSAGPRVSPPETHKFRMLAGAPHAIFKGGREWHIDSTRFPISTTVTGVILDLEPGALRELHWHPNADEWQYVIEGDLSVTMFGSHGRFSNGATARRRCRVHSTGLWALDRKCREQAESDADRF